MRHDVLPKLAQDLFGFGQGESQLLDPVAVFLQHRHFMDRVYSFIVRTDDQLHFYPHVAPSPLDILTIELNPPSVTRYPQDFDALHEERTGPFAVAAYNVAMLIGVQGQQYSGKEISAMLSEAGFTDIEVKPTFGYWSVVTGRKP